MFPMKGIKNFSNTNYSYVHSVLQSMSCLESSKQFLFQNSFNNFDQNFCITIELYNLMSMLNNGNEAFSSDIINYYNNKAKIIFQKNSIFSTDPYHFLYYLLELIHFENNIPQDQYYDCKILYNQNIDNQKKDDYMYALFYDFFRRTQNSMISNYFYNIEKYSTNCMNCGNVYFYGIKKILRFNIDLFRQYRDNFFPLRKGNKLNLEECFRCYIADTPSQCKNCNNFALTNTKLCCTTKVLIIYLDRITHNFYGDIDFTKTINILNYFSIKRSNNLTFNPIYNLKACISYDNSLGKYFADCNVVTNNNYNGWYRFIDDKVSFLGYDEKEIYRFEPQLLIYELDQQNYNNYSLNFNPFLNNNQYMSNFLNMFNNFNMPNTKNFNTGNQQFISQMQIQNANMINSLFGNTLNENNNNNFYKNAFIFNNNNNNNFNNNINNNNFNNVNNNINYNNQVININPFAQKKAFSLKFIYVPENGDQSETPSNRIYAQVISDFTFKKAVDNFFVKLVKPREAIKRFLLNEKEIEPDCPSTLSSLNIDENSLIKAIKSENFDELKIEDNAII